MRDETAIDGRNRQGFPRCPSFGWRNSGIPAGEIHGIVGANGARKSTLVKILCGLFPDYQGAVEVSGQVVRLSSPRIALDAGIGVVQQEPQLAWNLTVYENIFLGNSRRTNRVSGWVVDRKAMRRKCQLLLDDYGADISGDRPTGQLGRGHVQLVQIIKVLGSSPRILVLDEPATTLGEKERHALFARLRSMAIKGSAIILISHDIDDVFQICDRISVLRDGRKVAEMNTAQTTPHSVLQEMFGTVQPKVAGQRNEPGRPALRLDRLSTTQVTEVSLTLHQGEVLGLAGRAGVVSSVLRAAYGAGPRTAGKVYVDEHETSISSPRDAIRAGIGLLPEDRVRDGLFVQLSLLVNITLMVLRGMAPYGLLRWRLPRQLASSKVSELSIRTPALDSKVKVLSGGNQQKTLFARWLCVGPNIFLLEEPTAGMDVNAKLEILRITRDLKSRGAAILVASSDADELLLLCDRIIVLGKAGNSRVIAVDGEARPMLIGAMTGLGTAQ